MMRSWNQSKFIPSVLEMCLIVGRRPLWFVGLRVACWVECRQCCRSGLAFWVAVVVPQSAQNFWSRLGVKL